MEIHNEFGVLGAASSYLYMFEQRENVDFQLRFIIISPEYLELQWSFKCDACIKIYTNTLH